MEKRRGLSALGSAAKKDVESYRILNKKLFGQEEIAVCSDAEYFFPLESLAQKKVLFVIAVDDDGLESPPSPSLEVRPPKD